MAQAIDYPRLRQQMVERQIAARGVRSARVLEAMRKVRREGYVPSYLGEFAYDDTPLPIEEEQTISQPYIVAFMLEALELNGGERVLEIGTGSGYAAAVLAELAGEVFSIERHERLARLAGERLQRDGYANVHVQHGDGTLGWPEHAPFDAIVVAAGGPRVPESLQQQLAIGGRLVVPVGTESGLQQLLRIRRTGDAEFTREELADVRFVPLVGAEGWQAPPAKITPPRKTPLSRLVGSRAEPFAGIESIDWEPLLQRIGDSRLVLLGEATHGTAEFYRFRAALTRELIEQHGFSIVAVEGDWPDAAQIDRYVREPETGGSDWQALARFPAWMWRNREFAAFADWLRQHNLRQPTQRRVRFAGLDLYALHRSVDAVLRYLDATDAPAADVARHRYGCLTPYQRDPSAYGRAVLTGSYPSCEPEVLQVLQQLLQQRLDQLQDEDEAWFEAMQNAQLVADAEHYYRAMYYGAAESWNLRDRHMFACLERLLEFHGPTARAVVWAHNSHIGDATATEMVARGEHNLGQLCQHESAAGAPYLIGFGTDHGIVAAASHWGGPLQYKKVRPAHVGSYERVCHDTGIANFLLPLRRPDGDELLAALREMRLERAIGVIYRPETELHSHYFRAALPRQFDEYVWFDATTAVRPLPARQLVGQPDTWPFGV